MKVLHALNYHRSAWGSDKMWEKTIRLSEESGMEVGVFSRDSRSLSPSLGGKLRAFASGVYAPSAVQNFARTLREFQPDVVQTHELYPLISPWILKACTDAGVPVVHTCYDYRLTCPIATHFTNGKICRRCEGGNEQWAVLNNCRGHLAESAAYASRNAVARRFRLFQDHVTHFVVPTEFGKRYLVDTVGVPAAGVTIQPCVIPLPDTGIDAAQGGYIAFAGRFTVEKGSQVLIEAARATGLPVRLAGNAETHPGIRPGDPVECVMTNSPAELAAFYRGARMLVSPSIWEETFGVVAAEAMGHGLPVIAARIGALPYTVLHEETGLVFEPGDAGALAEAMMRLWNDPVLCRRLGAAARERVRTAFNEQVHIGQLVHAYEQAIAASRQAVRRPAA